MTKMWNMKKEKKEQTPRRKRTTPSVGVYLDDEINDRFTIGVNEERNKELKSGKKPTISKSSILKDYILDWLKKHKY